MARSPKTLSRDLCSLEIGLERRAHLGPSPVQQHPGISLLSSKSVTHFLRGAALHVTEHQHPALMLGQRLDGGLELLPCLPGQERTLGRGIGVREWMCPVSRLGRMIAGLEAVRRDRGRRLDLDVEASERYGAAFTCRTGLRAIDEDAKDPGLE